MVTDLFCFLFHSVTLRGTAGGGTTQKTVGGSAVRVLVQPWILLPTRKNTLV